MAEVISVKFRNKGKTYYFDPNGITATAGQSLIVETSKGLEFAECVRGNHEVDDDSIIPPLRPVVRIATDEDKKKNNENHEKEKRAFDICLEKIEKHGLDMKLVDVEYSFEDNKVLFFFTSDGRVNFRELVKDLASVLKSRIELRQIGVRDEARMLGGLGICGKPFCCTQFLDDFQPVSIKMAKTQGLSLNPTKISGTCGRLMCCLKYEQEAYEDLVKNVPKVDAFVETPAGKGSVVDVNLLRGQVRVRIEDRNELMIRTFPAAEVTVLGGKAMRAEFLAAKADEEAEKAKNTPVKVKPERPRRDVKKQPLGTLDDFVNSGTTYHMPEILPKPEPVIEPEVVEVPTEPESKPEVEKQRSDRRNYHRYNRKPHNKQRSNTDASGSTAEKAKIEKKTENDVAAEHKPSGNGGDKHKHRNHYYRRGKGKRPNNGEHKNVDGGKKE